ncbi:5'-nucleotidase [Flammeovirgaceae bacterium SG7u.111]|nr:5'-nucleotidase [Flammeovirgaceae bacterium SG7u.132]WPO33061.1 5'-nucleotidase [Flammeovirgaceae bacterium SG7u.111]
MKTWIFALLLILGTNSCQKRYVYQHVRYPDDAININSDLAEQDSAILTMITPYKQQMGDRLEEVIGELDKDMPKGYGTETLLGNFTSNLMIDFVEQKEGVKPDMAVMNFGGLRRDLYKGELKVADIYELMPFDNIIVVLTLSGETVQKLFEYTIEDGGVTIAGSKIVAKDSTFSSAEIGSAPFDKSKTYVIAVSDYLANGGGNMTFFSEAIATQNTGVMMRDAIIEFCKEETKKKKMLTSKLEGRLIKDSDRL